MSRFSVNPTNIDIRRSTFIRDSSVKFTANVGQVVPFYVDEVLPGDSFDLESVKLVRLPTLITPIMDNIYLDTYWFFVPNRLVWEHWREFCGENTKSAWVSPVEYTIPQLTAPADTGWNVGTIADYMGIPTGVPGLSVNALPFRAYALIMQEWFRDENLLDPLNISVGDATQAGVNTGNYITDCALGGLPFVAAKYHDYFTSCLPSPQKGPDVLIPVAEAGNLPVVPQAETVPSQYLDGSQYYTVAFPAGEPSSGGSTFGFSVAGQQVKGYSGNNTSGTEMPIINNLWAVASGNAAAATINQLRLAFQIQRLYERDARGGTRYIELLKSHFGVTSPDARLQRPEYLGGNRIPLSVEQVVQSSETATTPQGSTTGMSLSIDNHADFGKSFVEHGFVLGLCVARYHHTYQQGLERMWSRQSRFDYYWPALANIGEQAVLNKEIYAQGTDEDNEVFGYQEAWADYRYKPSRVSGEMRSQYKQSLDVWHLADDYDALPTLSPGWIQEDSNTVNRVIAVSDEVSNQLLVDIYIRNRTTRPMPLYSIPGLIDHN